MIKWVLTSKLTFTSGCWAAYLCSAWN